MKEMNLKKKQINLKNNDRYISEVRGNKLFVFVID